MKRSMGGVNNGDLAEIEKRVNLKVILTNPYIYKLEMTLMSHICQESILAVVAKKATPVQVVKSKSISTFPSATPSPLPSNHEFSQFRTPSGSFMPCPFNLEPVLKKLNLYKDPNFTNISSLVGQFYCAPCNLSLNSTSQFQQHQVYL